MTGGSIDHSIEADNEVHTDRQIGLDHQRPDGIKIGMRRPLTRNRLRRQKHTFKAELETAFEFRYRKIDVIERYMSNRNDSVQSRSGEIPLPIVIGAGVGHGELWIVFLIPKDTYGRENNPGINSPIVKQLNSGTRIKASGRTAFKIRNFRLHEQLGGLMIDPAQKGKPPLQQDLLINNQFF